MAGAESIDRLASKEILRREVEQRALEEREHPAPAPEPGPILTISRDESCGGEPVAAEIAGRLGWRLYDRDLVDRIAQDRHVDAGLVARLDETSYDYVQEWSNEIFLPGYVGQATYMRGLVHVIVDVAREGRAVIVGRGAQFLIPERRRLAIRLTAPFAWRVANFMSATGANHKDARRAVEDEDRRRAEFIRRNFGKDVADPLCYDLVVNTQEMRAPSAVLVILEALRARFPALAGLAAGAGPGPEAPR